MNWRGLLAASILAAYLALRAGAPLAAVAAGLFLMAGWSLVKTIRKPAADRARPDRPAADS